MSELISVCMPVYNRPLLALEAVTSILNQSYANLEMIVVDDGSTDGTPDVLRRIEDPRLRVVRRRRNHGNISCRNLAFKKARGSLVALMDSDDVAVPHRLAKQVHAIKRGFDVCGGHVFRAEKHMESSGRWQVPSSENQLRRNALFGCPLPNPTIMMTRAFLERDPFRFDQSYFPAADYRAWSDALFDGQTRIFAISEPLIFLRHHESRLSLEKLEAQNDAAARVRVDLLRRFGVDEELIQLHCHYVRSPDDMQMQEIDALADLYFDHLPRCHEAFAGREARDFFTGKLRNNKTTVTVPPRAPDIDVSVVMPVYNVEPFVGEAIESVLGQDGASFELILIDDGSTDGSSEVARGYAEKYSNVRYVRQDNRGLSEARNAGLQLAQAEFVLFVDSDDMLNLGALEAMVSHARMHDCDVIVGSHDAVEFEVGQRKQRHRNPSTAVYRNKIFQRYVDLNFGHIACNRLIRTCLARRLRFFPGIMFEDNLYCAELFLLARRVGTLTDVTLDYRIRPGSITHRMTPAHIESWCTILYQAAHLYWSTHLPPPQRNAFGKLLHRFVRETHSRLRRVEEPSADLEHQVAVATAVCVGAAYDAMTTEIPAPPRPAPPAEKVGVLRHAERKFRAFRKAQMSRFANGRANK